MTILQHLYLLRRRQMHLQEQEEEEEPRGRWMGFVSWISLVYSVRSQDQSSFVLFPLGSKKSITRDRQAHLGVVVMLTSHLIPPSGLEKKTPQREPC